MTFFHFVNCAALAYVPYFLVYKFSGLAEYNAFWRCVQAGAVYLVTQLVKMLVLATFFPASDALDPDRFDVVAELLRCSMDLSDLLGMHLIMTQVVGKSQQKTLITGVGWGAAELISTRLLPLWFGARGTEFDWKYMQMSLDSNVTMVQHLVTASLVWLYRRHDLPSSATPLVLALLLAAVYRTFVADLLVMTLGLSGWSVLGAKALFTLASAALTIQIHSSQASASAHYYN